jgi:hypothetical protein
MKCIPITFAGRLVCAPSRVSEIDELDLGVELLEDLLLQLLVLGRGLDREVDASERHDPLPDADPLHRRPPVRLRELALLDLLAEDLVDPGLPALGERERHVGEDHLATSLGRDLGDAAAHLSGAEDPDRLRSAGHALLLAFSSLTRLATVSLGLLLRGGNTVNALPKNSAVNETGGLLDCRGRHR